MNPRSKSAVGMADLIELIELIELVLLQEMLHHRDG
jgi:hypothetical protein